MQSYLFKTSDEQMQRYKEAARLRGQSLADFLREAADAFLADDGQTKLTEGDHDAEHSAQAGQTARLAPSVSSGKRSYEPDPKGGKKK